MDAWTALKTSASIFFFGKKYQSIKSSFKEGTLWRILVETFFIEFLLGLRTEDWKGEKKNTSTPRYVHEFILEFLQEFLVGLLQELHLGYQQTFF